MRHILWVVQGWLHKRRPTPSDDVARYAALTQEWDRLRAPVPPSAYLNGRPAVVVYSTDPH